MQFPGTTPTFNQTNPSMPVRMQQQPMRAPSPMGIPVNRPGVVGPAGISPGRIPTNLNYPINQGRIPPTNNNLIPPSSPFMGQGQPQLIQPNTPQFLPMQYVGQSMGPPPLPQGNYIGHNLGAPRGAPYNIIPARPTYIGYRKLDDSSLINSSINKQKIDTTIQQQPIYCVICQAEYLAKDKQQHIKRHQRKTPSTTQVIRKLKQYKQQYTGLQTRPIVEPEEYNIQYNPNSFVVEQQTNFLTNKVQPIPEIPRHQFGVGTSDLINNTTSPTTNQRSTVFQPETVRLTQHDGEQVTYVNNAQYQGVRTLRETQVNPPPPTIPNNTNSESRFTRNTFISDEPAPVVQPNSGIYGRQTIQSQQFRGSQAYASQRVGAQQPLSYASSTPTPIPVSNTLPPRDTVMSQDYRSSQLAPQPNTTNSQYLSVSQKIANNHQSVMSPIRQQSENRQTSSLPHNEELTYEQQQLAARAGSSQINSSTVYQQNQARSTVNPPVVSDLSDYEKQKLPVVGSMSSQSQKIPTDHSILDTFDYNSAVVNTVIPRQSRKVIQFDPNTNNITNINNNPSQSGINNQDIPISAIIQDKNAY